MSEAAPNICDLCGHPKDSRVHMEGRGDIHVVNTPPAESVGESGVDSSAASDPVASDTPPALEDMTNAELRELAAERGVDVKTARNKAELIAALDQA